MQVKIFTFNPFSENTLVLFDESKECIIVDPGNSNATEDAQLFDFINAEQLKPVGIYNTHCHIDHVLGINSLIAKYSIPFYCHQLELEGLRAVPNYAPMYGMQVSAIDEPTGLIDENSIIEFGNTKLELRFTPGHSMGSLCFISQADKVVIGGDVLFQGSIGRADLPGGNFTTLMESIVSQLLTLEDDMIVFPGHGPHTTIGSERVANPFILEYLNKK